MLGLQYCNVIFYSLSDNCVLYKTLVFKEHRHQIQKRFRSLFSNQCVFVFYRD